jgi:hypothetical protein
MDRLHPATGRIVGTAAFGADLPHVECGLGTTLHATAPLGQAFLQAGHRQTDTADDQHNGHQCRYNGSMGIGHHQVPSAYTLHDLSAFFNLLSSKIV